MNSMHRTALDQLKDAIDGVFAESVVWVPKEGGQQEIVGIFNRLDAELAVKPSNQKREANTKVEFVAATLSLAPHLAVMKVEDIIIQNSVSYQVLPFNEGEFETVIPLKLRSEKDPSWR